MWEEGPFKLFERFRDLLGVTYEGENFTSKLFSCVYCLSMWTSIFFWVLFVLNPLVGIIVAGPFALSAGVCFIDHLIEN
jgi:hypothetical protein